MTITDGIWQQWLSKWSFVTDSAIKRGWKNVNLKINDPVSLNEVNNFIAETNIILPDGFIEVITHYSSAVEITWEMSEEDKNEIPDFLKDLRKGAHTPLWDFYAMKSITKDISEAAEKLKTNPYNIKTWSNKTGICREENGNYVAFDTTAGAASCPVILLCGNHEDEHGKILADSFTDFITFRSNAGGASGCLIDDPVKAECLDKFLRGKEILFNDHFHITKQIFKEYNEDKSVKAEGAMKELKRSGKWIYNNRRADKAEQNIYRDVKHDEPVTLYHWNGKISDEYVKTAKENVLIHQLYNEKGKLISQSEGILHDWKFIKHGPHKEWFDNGILKRSGQFVNDKEQGEFRLWFRDGSEKAICIYENGLQMSVSNLF